MFYVAVYKSVFLQCSDLTHTSFSCFSSWHKSVTSHVYGHSHELY